MVIVYNYNQGQAAAMNIIELNNSNWKSYIYRRCSPFTCTVSSLHTYVDILNGYHCIKGYGIYTDFENFTFKVG